MHATQDEGDGQAEAGFGLGACFDGQAFGGQAFGGGARIRASAGVWQ